MKKFFVPIITLILISTLTHAQWHPSSGLHFESISCMGVSGDTLFAGAQPEVYISTNNGENWELIGSSPVPHDKFLSILIDGNHIYAGSMELLMVSSDRGQTWATHTNYKEVTSLILAGDTLVMAANKRVYFSTDQGNNFVYAGLQNPTEFLDLAYLNGVFYASTRYGLHRSYNRGISWSMFTNMPTLVAHIPPGITESFPDIFKLTIHNGSLYAGGVKRLFVTHNDGQTWDIIADLDFSPTTAILVNDDEIYLSLISKAYRSIDHGSNWTPIKREDNFNCLIKQGNYVFAGGNWDVLRSGPQPEPVFLKFGEGMSKPTISNLFMNDNKLYCLAAGKRPSYGTILEDDNMIASSADGIEWTRKKELNYIHPGSFSQSKKDTVYYGQNGNKVIKGNLNSNFFKSYASPKNVSCLEFSGDTVFCGSSQGVYFSTDYCNSWTRCNDGIWSFDITDLLMINDTLYASTRDQGVFRSTNRGASWSDARQGLISMNINKLKNLQDKIYAFTDLGFSFSANGGVSWNNLNSGIESIKVNDIFVHNDVLLIATVNGLYISRNNGSSWMSWNTGLEGIETLCLYALEDKILAGTKGNSVWYRSLSGLGVNDVPQKEAGINVYPNPAKDMLSIVNFNYPKMRSYELQLINTLGQTIMQSTVSTRELNIDLKELRIKGIYYLHLSNPSFNYSETKKIIIQ